MALKKLTFILVLIFAGALLPISAGADTLSYTGEYIIALKPEVPPRSARRNYRPSINGMNGADVAFLQRAGFSHVRAVSLPNTYVVRISNILALSRNLHSLITRTANLEPNLMVQKEASPRMSRTAEAAPQFAAIQSESPAQAVSAQSYIFPNDPRAIQDAHLEDLGVNLANAWQYSTGSSDVVIAVLGNGIDLTNPDLIPNLWKDPAPGASVKETVDGFNWFNTSSRTPPQDDHGISTHVAGLMGAKGNNGYGFAGVNWDVKLMPVRIVRVSGQSVITDVEAMIQGIDYVIRKKAAGHKVAVIYNFLNPTYNSEALKSKIKQARDADILFVTAAGDGNIGAGTGGINLNSSTLAPAAFGNLPDMQNVIVVGSYRGDYSYTAPFLRFVYSGFSNYGTQKVHLAAPGEAIKSYWINNNYGSFTWAGTATSTAFVAGAAALIKSYNPSLTATAIKNLIINNVRTYPAEFGTKVISQGVLDIGRAIAAAPFPIGDCNNDGIADGSDFLSWQRGNSGCDFNNDGVVNGADLAIWEATYGNR